MPTLAIIPTDGELDQLIQAFEGSGFVVEAVSDDRVRRHVVPAIELALAVGGLGKTQFGVQTQYLIGRAPWSLVVCAGAAGGLVDSVAIGDVVIGTETVEHDIRTVRRSVVPRFPGAEFALERCKAINPDGFRVHLGGIASGDEDVVSEERRSQCQQLTGALAVAWEGAGGARACVFSGVPYLEVRAVADRANADGPRDFKRNLAAAMGSLASVLRVLAG